MTRVADIMSHPVHTIGPEESLRRAAAMMREFDIGALPVCHDQRLLGMVTDRDMVIRGMALGLTPDGGCVSDVMTQELVVCRSDQDLTDALRSMSRHQLRRLPVLDAEKQLVGIVALADVALGVERTAPSDADADDLGRAVRRISEPTQIQATLL